MDNVRPPDRTPQESAVEIVAVALRVLKTRDKIDISSDLIEERARNIVTALDLGSISSDAAAEPAMTKRARGVVLRCTLTEQCDFHRDGGPEVERCPGVCDADGCTLDGEIEVGVERLLCEAHAGIELLARAVRALVDREIAKGGA